MSLLSELLEVNKAHVAQEFDDLEKFAAHLVICAAVVKKANKATLKEAARLVKEDAREQIGNYQPQVGNYLEWAPLAESTLDQKYRRGLSPQGEMDADAPLYMDGDLKKSFRSTLVSYEEIIIGSTDPNMEWHEFGTSKMPPRSVLGPALLKHIKEIQALSAAAAVSAIIVGQRIGYKFDKLGGIGGLEE